MLIEFALDDARFTDDSHSELFDDFCFPDA